MREIKFRAFDPLAKRFVLIKSLNFNTHGDLFTLMLKENGKESIQGAGAYPISQYTGLKDKNGKEIYEGDIINWKDNLLEVKWGSVGWILFGSLFKKFGYPVADGCNEINTKGYAVVSEIIGNIYENPELIRRHC